MTISTPKHRNFVAKDNSEGRVQYAVLDGDFNKPNPYFSKDWVVNYVPDYPQYAQPKGPGQGLFVSNGNFSTVPADVHNAALTKVNDQLRLANSFFEDWYERQQAYALIASTAKELLRFVRNYKNPAYYKNLAKKSTPSDLPSAWLTYQFGIKPMLSTIDSAMQLIGGDFPQWDIDGSSGFSTRKELDLSFNYPYSSERLCSTTTIYKIGCTITGINPNRALLGATGLNEPLSSAWNVIPWGWAIDYFVNVGDLLSNVENNHPGVYVDHWYRTIFEKESSAGYPSKTGYTRPESRFFAEGSCTTVRREPLPNEPSYRLAFDFPLLGSNRSANLLSAVALTMKGKN